jgi:hypothetical protein
VQFGHQLVQRVKLGADTAGFVDDLLRGLLVYPESVGFGLFVELREL